MPSNSNIASKQRNHDGETTQVQVVSLAGVSGTEDSYTFADINGDATNGLDVDVTRVIPGTGATNLGKAEDAVHTSGDVGVMALAVRQDSQADLGADGDYVPFTIDDSGGLRVSIVAGAGSGGTAAADDADFTAGTTQGTPAMGVYESSPTSVTNGDLGIVGITQTRALKVHVASGGVSGVVDDAAFAAGTTEGIAFMARAGASPPSVGDGDAGAVAMTTTRALHVAVQSIAAGNNNIGDVDIATIAAGSNAIGNVGIIPRASGGLSIFRHLDIDETPREIKGTPGQLYSIHAMNLTAGLLYLKFYNATAANVSVGTTVPVLTFPIPTLGDTNGAGFTKDVPAGFAFSTAITVACTTGLADNNSGAPATNACVINIGYA